MLIGIRAMVDIIISVIVSLSSFSSIHVTRLKYLVDMFYNLPCDSEFTNTTRIMDSRSLKIHNPLVISACIARKSNTLPGTELIECEPRLWDYVIW